VTLTLLLQLAVAAPGACQPASTAIAYTLSIPEAGLDDPAAYDGYSTRFFRDAAGNTFQIYLKEREGRLVHIWANAANESAGLTVRDSANDPVPLAWASDSSCVSSRDADRSLEYRLLANQPEVRIGHFVLGSMRIERDFQYPRHHLEPFGDPFVVRELREFVENISQIPELERQRHLALLNARSVSELGDRLHPSIRLLTEGAQQVARIEQASLDGRNRLLLELGVPMADAQMDIMEGHTLRVRARSARPLQLTLRVTTNAAPLTPLQRADIFNRPFFAFYDSLRIEHDRALAGQGATADARVMRFRLLERQVRGMELLSSREKLMAGMPNYATYFGRDMQMSALLMQPIWSSSMNEHVIGSVLRKLRPNGEVSHEEALGGQAIREHAQEYNALVAESRAATDTAEAMRLLRRAGALLTDMQAVRENHAMVDDEFQLPVLAAKYLADPDITDERKRAFLNEPGWAGDDASRLSLLLRNLGLVAELSSAYVQQPIAENMIAFAEREPGRYHASSWRDSGAGYGNGRFAMDVNVVWVPHALHSAGVILQNLRRLGYTDGDLERASPTLRASVLGGYARAPESMDRAIEVWQGTARHFTVRLSAEEARARIERKLASLPSQEAQYWRDVLSRNAIPERGLEFLALSLDGAGRPVAVMHTDVATRWFLDDVTASVVRDPGRVPEVVNELNVAFLPYPIGLLVNGLGPLVANDAYATPEVWAAFEQDDYHSPRVVWGREVNLILLGLMRQIDAARAANTQAASLQPYLAALDAALRKTLASAEESGLKHNEVWSYRIEGDRLQPIRWGSSTDVQLWNLTNLVVEFLLARER
jgi:hypothetical protein